MVDLHLDAPTAGHRTPAGSGSVIPRRTGALVNNMPDGAFVQTETQFLDLLDIGAGEAPFDVRLYTMAGVPRSPATALRVADRYSPWSDLFDDPPDVLIVTGANPIEPVIEDEAFWADMVHLLTWATGTVASLLLSCLSAHAALTLFDGIERQRLPAKCTGVFPQQVDAAHPLSRHLAGSGSDTATSGSGSDIVLPHSRLSAVPTDMVRAAGYDVALFAEDSGWSVATRTVDRSTVVLLQAHPEYGPTSLLREYQRDVGRYVRRQRDGLPVLPRHCAAPADQQRLEDLHRQIITERDPLLVDSFPFDDVEARAPWPWRATATQLYTNWLAGVPVRRA